jgi:H+-transporting ATPase
VPLPDRLREGFLSVDQSALTGESLPVDRKAGDVVYSGSIARTGEMSALVAAIGWRPALAKRRVSFRRRRRPRRKTN